MQSHSVVLLQGNARANEFLAFSLSQSFSSVQRIQSVDELRNKIAKSRAEIAILDLERTPLNEVATLVHDFPALSVICTHRVPDEEMWADALRAGAADMCQTNDISGIVRAARKIPMRQSTAA